MKINKNFLFLQAIQQDGKVANTIDISFKLFNFFAFWTYNYHQVNSKKFNQVSLKKTGKFLTSKETAIFWGRKAKTFYYHLIRSEKLS